MLRAFTVGSVLSRGLSMLGEDFLRLAAIGVLAVVPGNLAIVAIVQASQSNEAVLALMLLPFLVMILSAFIMQGAVVHGVYERLCGRRFRLRKSLLVALRRIWMLLLVSIVASLLTMLGAVLLIIPAFIVACTLWVSAPVTVVERGTLGHALRRSSELTRNSRLRIFGVLFVLGAANFVVSMIAQAMFKPDMTGGIGMVYVMTVASSAVSSVTSVLMAVVSAVGYYTLRVEKEGIQLDDLVAVFE